MREHVVDRVADPQVCKTQRRNIVVELECAESRRVGLECENQDVAHQSHVLVDILRQPVCGPFSVRLFQRRPPTVKSLKYGLLFEWPPSRHVGRFEDVCNYIVRCA